MSCAIAIFERRGYPGAPQTYSCVKNLKTEEPCTSLELEPERLRLSSLLRISIRYNCLAASTRAMLTEPVVAPMTESHSRNLKARVRGSVLPREVTM